MAETLPSPQAPAGRRPYHGSCRCGNIKYIVYFSLPPPLVDSEPLSPNTTVPLRKCNCTACHKMAFFHIRPKDSPNDFQLLSPSDPSELSDYRCGAGVIHWYFCGKCGVRCFSFNGSGEVRDAEIDGERRKIWAPKAEGWDESDYRVSYLTVNAQTLEAGQEGLNLLEWTEKQWIAYVDCLNFKGDVRLKNPHAGGTY